MYCSWKKMNIYVHQHGQPEWIFMQIMFIFSFLSVCVLVIYCG